MRAACVAAIALAVPYAAHAQQNVIDEVELLRQESSLEASGDLNGAELILRRILDVNPGSLTSIISLERVLRVQNRLADLVPYVNQLLIADPTSPIGYQMLVRTYSNLNQLEDLNRAAEQWMKATPKLEVPYREVARVLSQRRDYEKALQVLTRGRERIGRPNALALEIGDTYVSMGDAARAVKEWEKAIGVDARGFMLVQRRVAQLPDGGARVLPPLIDALVKPPTTPARQKAAATLAIDAGLAAQAVPIVRALATTMKGAERQSFLVEMGRKADAVKLTPLARWAYTELLNSALPDEQMLAIRSRLAELALAAGDTAKARESYAAIESSYAPGSPERRQAIALRIELTARDGNVADALKAYENFKREADGTPELERAAAAVAGAMLDSGDATAAEQMLVGISGPRASLVRGRIALRAGDNEKALNALMTAAPALQGEEATETIALITLVGRLSAPSGELLGSALAKAWAGDRKAAVTMLESGASALPEEERAAILDYAAGIADRASLDADAERIRRLIVTQYAESLEAPQALLSLARIVMSHPGGQEEAREMLERLILDYPKSALVPQARRELDLLHQRVPSS